VKNLPSTSVYVIFMLIVTAISVVASAQCAVTTGESKVAPGVPRLVKLSGELKDTSGNLLTNTVAILFAVYGEQTGGAPLWQETQNVQFSRGRYTAFLGDSTTSGIPAELFASGEPRWLGITVLLPGEEEQPRIILASVPYALKAVDADTLGGLPASSYVRADTTAGGIPIPSSGVPSPVSSKARAVVPAVETTVSPGGSTAPATSAGGLTPASPSQNNHSRTPGANDAESGQISIVAGNSSSRVFLTRWMAPPLCTLTPTSDPHALGGYWVTSSTSSLTVYVHYAGRITFNYRCYAASGF
jgi:hypothetical protein